MLSDKEFALLQNCFLFKNESLQAMTELISDPRAAVLSFAKGEIIFGSREHLSQLGFLLSGKATALCSDNGKSSIKIFKSGELFGAAGVFSDTADTSFCKTLALSSCRVLFISRQMVEEILFKNPDRAIEYIRFLSDRVEFLNRRIKTFTSKEALCRVAKYLLQNAASDGVCRNLNFSALAKSLDISRASLYRARGELVNLKAISIEGKTVTILSRAALENIN